MDARTELELRVAGEHANLCAALAQRSQIAAEDAARVARFAAFMTLLLTLVTVASVAIALAYRAAS